MPRLGCRMRIRDSKFDPTTQKGGVYASEHIVTSFKCSLPSECPVVT